MRKGKLLLVFVSLWSQSFGRFEVAQLFLLVSLCGRFPYFSV
jgi:hypothetical protein